MSAAYLPSVLVVDDDPDVLRLVEHTLRTEAVRVRPVLHGHQALRAAQLEAPDLVLLDISMPRVDGPELCRLLRIQDPNAIPAPVLFLTGSPTRAAEGFGAGAVDFIVKPFEPEELAARVRTHLELHRLRLRLTEENEALRRLQALKEDLSAMVVHDMQGPITSLLCWLDLCLNSPETAVELVDQVRSGVRTLQRMTDEMLDLARLEDEAMPVYVETCDAPTLVEHALANLEIAVPRERLRIDAPPMRGRLPRELAERVLTNLISNANRYGPSEGEIEVEVAVTDSYWTFRVRDHGPGVAHEDRERIFGKFEQLELTHGKRGTGLGLSFCKAAVEAMGGEIQVENAEPTGAVFWFRVPLEQPALR